MILLYSWHNLTFLQELRMSGGGYLYYGGRFTFPGRSFIVIVMLAGFGVDLRSSAPELEHTENPVIIIAILITDK